jgi:hypothetical protein
MAYGVDPLPGAGSAMAVDGQIAPGDDGMRLADPNGVAGAQNRAEVMGLVDPVQQHLQIRLTAIQRGAASIQAMGGQRLSSMAANRVF